MEETKGFVSAKDALAALEQYQGCFFPHSAAVKIINQLSREDVEPVIHGRWVMKETMIRSPFAKNAYCSVCLEETSYAHNYCPNCGAKMDKEES